MAQHRAKREYRVEGTARVPEQIAVNRTTHAFSGAQAVLQIEKILEKKHKRTKIFWVGEPTAELTAPVPEPIPVPAFVHRGKPATLRRAAPQQLGFGFQP